MALKREAQHQPRRINDVDVVLGATLMSEEAGTLDSRVIAFWRLTANWFVRRLSTRVHQTTNSDQYEALPQGGGLMGVCEVCGNDYDTTIEISVAGEQHVFDSFECAINALAPTCAHCERSSATASRATTPFTAVPIVHTPPASRRSSTAYEDTTASRVDDEGGGDG